LRPRIPSSLAPLFTLGTAVALHDAVERNSGLDVDIKWPNDLLVGGRKAAGILAEMQAEIDMVHTLIIGVGLNVNHAGFPPELADHATSLRIASGQTHSRIEILLGFLEQFEQLCGDFEKFGAAAIISPWTRSSSFAQGRVIEIHDGVRRIGGITRGLNPLGALRVEKEDGHIEEVYSGDVVRWQQAAPNSR
jgi:BirA family biotin operon repressor/biotin-[acetyl-CoA-carboxylase] ligase